MATLTLTINGVARTIEAEPDMPLLWVLRDLLGLTGTKFGCGTGMCGACTVLVDGAASRSCVMPVADRAGGGQRDLRRLRRTHPAYADSGRGFTSIASNEFCGGEGFWGGPPSPSPTLSQQTYARAQHSD